MSTVLVETLQTSAGPAARETRSSAPAVETVNARLDQLGAFRQDNAAAAQAAVALTLQAVDANAPVGVIAGRAGTIVGVVARSSGDLTAGTASFSATKGGTAVGDAAVLSDLVQQVITDFTTAVAFAAGDALGIKITTSAGYLPVTSELNAWLLIRWAA